MQRASRATVAVGTSRRGVGPACSSCSASRTGTTQPTPTRLAGKVARLRIFEDDDGRFDRSLRRHRRRGARREPVHADRGHGARGTGPSFSGAAAPEVAEPLVERFCDGAPRRTASASQTGVFGARMAVELVNDGPVTIVLELTATASDARPRLRAPVLSSPRTAFQRLDEMGAESAPISCWEMGRTAPFRAQEESWRATCSQPSESSTEEIVPTVERAVPGVEVLAVELLSPSRFCVYVDHPRGRRPRAVRARHASCSTTIAATYTIDVSSPGLGAAAAPAGALPRRRRSRRSQIRTAGDDRRQEAVPRPGRRRDRPEHSGSSTSARQALDIPYDDDRPGQPDRRGIGEVMSQEIMEGIRTIEREKGIEDGHARRGARGRAARCVQEDPGCLPPRRGDPRRRGRVPRVLDRDPRRPRGAAARRGARGRDRRARADRGGDGRAAAHADQRRRPRARLVAGARGADGARRRDARTTSAASPR